MRDTLVEDLSPRVLHDSTTRLQHEKILNCFDDTASILCKLSGHHYVLYGYPHEQELVFKHSIGSDFYHISSAESPLGYLSEQRYVLLDDIDLGDLLNQIFKPHDLHPKTASVIHLQTKFNDFPVYFILLSDTKYVVEPPVWQWLKSYLQQQVLSFNAQYDVEQLKAKVSDLEDINAGRAKYFSVIAHDLRAPFHGILGCADILANENDTLDAAAAQRLTEYLYDTTQSTYGLLENLLNWAMAEGGRFHQKKVHFRISDVIQNVFDLLCAFAYKKQIRLQCDLTPNLFAYADVRMVTSILQNLTSNALKFTPADAGKKVKIMTTIQADQVQILIQDEGVGMMDSQIEKLLQEQTIPSTQGTSGEKGTGLGVILCKRFLEMNGGSMTIESVLEEGTRFVVCLPLGDKEG